MKLDFLAVFNFIMLSLYIYCCGFVHVLQVLIGLEFIVINILVLMFNFTYFSYLDYLPLFFLIFSVCEGIVGISLMIFMVRCSGMELIKSISLIH